MITTCEMKKSDRERNGQTERDRSMLWDDRRLFGMVMTKIFKVDKHYTAQCEDEKDGFQYDKLGHLSLLFGGSDVNDKRQNNKSQCQKNSYCQGNPREGLMNKNTKDKHRKTQFCGIIKELCQVITGVLSHAKNIMELESVCQ